MCGPTDNNVQHPNMRVCRPDVPGVSHGSTSNSTRSKDPLRNLFAPARAAPPPASSSRRTAQCSRREWRAEQVLGDVVRSLQVLDAGGERPEYWGKQGVNMNQADHGELSRLRKVCAEFVDRHGDALGATPGEQRAARTMP